MGKGFKHGSGGSSGSLDNVLNFSVVAYATEAELLAATPAENTIGVVTSIPITAWAFSVDTPENPVEFMVHFTTSSASSTWFNALKKNYIGVYPLFARQYVGGAWVEVSARIYQDGAWVDWVAYLCKNGKINADLVGELKSEAVSEDGSNTGLPIVTENTDNITIKMNSSGNAGGIAYFEKKIDLTPFRKLVFDGQMYAEWQWAGIGIWTEIGATQATNRVASFLTGSLADTPSLTLDGKATIDISGLSGEYYIGFTITGKSSSTYITMRELYLE